MPAEKKRRISKNIPFITSGSEELLSENEACSLFNLTKWTNSIIPIGEYGEDPDINALISAEIIETEMLQSKIAIEEIDVNGRTMYGLVAIDTIYEDESIIYGAKMHTVEEAGGTTDDDYKIKISQDNIISAKEFGNMARFMNHAPEEEDAKKMLNMAEEDLETLATANFTSRKVKAGDLSYTLLTANREIRAGERLYWDYGLEYFRKIPVSIALFDINGNLLSPDIYTWKDQQLQFDWHGTLKVIDDIEKILKNDGLIESPVSDHTPPYYLNIHAKYIRDILEQNPSLADNYFINIPAPDLNDPLVKIFNADDHETMVIIENHLREQIIPSGVNPEHINISIQTYLDLENDNTRFARKRLKFFLVEIPDAEILQQIQDTCDQLEIECHCNEGNNQAKNISLKDLFKNLPHITLDQLQPPNPVQTPVRRFSFLAQPPLVPVANHNGIIPIALEI